MGKNKEKILERNLEQKVFKNAAEAIKGGKESGNLTNVELIENLVKGYKGKTVQAPIEVIVTSAIFLNARELMGTIEALKSTLHVKMVKEFREIASKEKLTAKDAMSAIMLAAILAEGSTKIQNVLR